LNLKASRETLNRTILNKGLKAYRAPKKFYISPENIEKRFSFSLQMANKRLKYWKKVIFTDESSFQLMNANGRTLIRRFSNENFEESNFQLTSQGETLMVWGAISSEGVGPLARIDTIEENETTLNGSRYVTLLQRYLLRNYHELKEHKLIFQQDNAPSHRYRGVSEWLEKKEIKKLQ